MQEEKRKWSDLSSEEKEAITRTEPNEARFWSGSTSDDYGNEIGGENNAKALAEKDGGKTLEMKLDENNIDSKNMQGRDWKEASEKYAQGASGDVKCYKGDNVRNDSVYNNSEKDKISGNDKIKSVTETDNVKGNEVKASYTRNPDTNSLEDSKGNKFTESSQKQSTEQSNKSPESKKETNKGETSKLKEPDHDYYNGYSY